MFENIRFMKMLCWYIDLKVYHIQCLKKTRLSWLQLTFNGTVGNLVCNFVSSVDSHEYIFVHMAVVMKPVSSFLHKFSTHHTTRHSRAPPGQTRQYM